MQVALARPRLLHRNGLVSVALWHSCPASIARSCRQFECRPDWNVDPQTRGPNIPLGFSQRIEVPEDRLLRAQLTKISSLPSRNRERAVLSRAPDHRLATVSDNGSRASFEVVLLGFIS